MCFWMMIILWLLSLSPTQSYIIFHDNAEDFDYWDTVDDVHIYSNNCLEGDCFDFYGYFSGQSDPSITSISISTVNYENIQLQYWMIGNRLETNEECRAFYSIDGGSNFKKIAYITGSTNDQPHNELLDLPDTADNNPNLKIRFTLTVANDNDPDVCYVDEVYVLGTPIAATSTSSTTNPTTSNPTTPNPTTSAPTTTKPTTSNPTTSDPTTAIPTTAIPTTAIPTTALPTTAIPTTANPTTNIPTTSNPTTSIPTARPTTWDQTTTTTISITNIPTTGQEAEVDITTTSNDIDNNYGKQRSDGLMIGMIVLLIGLILLTICIACFIIKRHRNKYNNDRQRRNDKMSTNVQLTDPSNNKENGGEFGRIKSVSVENTNDNDQDFVVDEDNNHSTMTPQFPENDDEFVIDGDENDVVITPKFPMNNDEFVVENNDENDITPTFGENKHIIVNSNDNHDEIIMDEAEGDDTEGTGTGDDIILEDETVNEGDNDNNMTEY